jgi:hypothetical protein
VTDIKGYHESAEELIDKIVGRAWIKFHPPLDANAEPDYDQETDAVPLVNAIADVLTEQTAQLYYQRILVGAGPFTTEQKDKANTLYDDFKLARTHFLEKTLVPMRYEKKIWRRSNVNKAAFNKMMQQLHEKAKEFEALIPQIAKAGMDIDQISHQYSNLIAFLFPILDSERLV